MEDRETENEADRKDQPAREVPAEAVFGKDREIVIVHDGSRYRLRITRKNKLILQK
jgi:hemin uptake protein HemP